MEIMNRRYIVLFEIVSLVLLGFLVQASSAAEAVELKIKWPAGKRYLNRMVIEQDTETHVPSLPQPLNRTMKQTIDYSLTVLKQLPGGGREIEMEYLTVKMKMETHDKSMSFDSDSDPMNDGVDPLTAVMRNTVGVRFKYSLDGAGKVEKVEGVKEFVEKVGEKNPQTKPLLAVMFNEESCKQMFGGAIESDWLPPEPVMVGETWNSRKEMSSGPLGALQTDYKYKFEGWENHLGRRCAVLEFAGAIKCYPEDAASQTSEGMNVSIKDGTTSGTTWFDPKLGMAVDTFIEQDIHMEMNVPGPDGTRQTVKNRIKQKTSLQLIKVETADQQ